MRKKYEAKFKVRVTIKALKERGSLHQLASKYGVSTVQTLTTVAA